MQTWVSRALWNVCLFIWGDLSVSDRLLFMHYMGTEFTRTLPWRKRLVMWIANQYYHRVIKRA